MKAASFLFYIIAYTIGVLNLAVLWALYSRDREPTYRREFFLMLSFAVNLLCRIVENYQGTMGFNMVVGKILYCGIFLSTGLMTWALPVYIHGFSPHRLSRALDKGFAAAGIIFALTAICEKILFGRDEGGYASFFFLMAVVLYSIGNGVYRSIRDQAKVRASGTSTMALKIGIVTVVLFPLIIACDFFGAQIPILDEIFPTGFYAISIIFLLWSALMLGERAPTLFAGPSRVPDSSAALDPDPGAILRFHISEREREVLVLLLRGKSYTEIADLLCISLATVKTHVSHIYKKVGVGSKMQLAHTLMSA
jgi:DNA-binding CsgD family transcriptional regulator